MPELTNGVLDSKEKQNRRKLFGDFISKEESIGERKMKVEKKGEPSSHVNQEKSLRRAINRQPDYRAENLRRRRLNLSENTN